MHRFPTYVLSHWTRDRIGAKLSIEQAVKMQTLDTAAVVGMSDRGSIQLANEPTSTSSIWRRSRWSTLAPSMICPLGVGDLMQHGTRLRCHHRQR